MTNEVVKVAELGSSYSANVNFINNHLFFEDWFFFQMVLLISIIFVTGQTQIPQYSTKTIPNGNRVVRNFFLVGNLTGDLYL